MGLVTLVVTAIGYTITAAEPSSFGHWSASEIRTRSARSRPRLVPTTLAKRWQTTATIGFACSIVMRMVCRNSTMGLPTS